MGKWKEILLRLHRDDRGAMSTEMILIVALIAVPLIVVLAVFRTTILGWFDTQKANLNSNLPAAPPSP